MPNAKRSARSALQRVLLVVRDALRSLAQMERYQADECLQTARSLEFLSDYIANGGESAECLALASGVAASASAYVSARCN